MRLRVMRLRLLRRLVEIERDVRLPLVMGLVPADQAEHVADRQATLFEEVGNFAEAVVAVLLERGHEVFARAGKDFADKLRRGDIVVRRAAATESRPKFRPCAGLVRGKSL